MSDVLKWLEMSLALGAGANCGEILAAFSTPEELLSASPAELRMSGVLTPSAIARLEARKPGAAEAVLEQCRRNSWQCLTPEDEDYPRLLNSIKNPPAVLFVQGSLKGINSALCFGIVGTREPVPDSVKTARRISGEMALAGAVIVSGGALGIDTAAHEGAMAAGGRTVAVLGCGLGERYLMSNAAMRSEICQSGGALISEFPPFTPASRTTFPIRNRIISGMSTGVLVVEAGEKSGSIITANCASEQGRDLFAVPGDVVTSAYAGANKLIREGAMAVTCADDILREYSVLYPDLLRPVSEKREEKKSVPVTVMKKSDSALSPDERAVYAAFESEPLYPGDIAAKTGMTVSRVMNILTLLEIGDYVRTAPGGRYEAIL